MPKHWFQHIHTQPTTTPSRTHNHSLPYSVYFNHQIPLTSDRTGLMSSLLHPPYHHWPKISTNHCLRLLLQPPAQLICLLQGHSSSWSLQNYCNMSLGKLLFSWSCIANQKVCHPTDITAGSGQYPDAVWKNSWTAQHSLSSGLWSIQRWLDDQINQTRVKTKWKVCSN